MSNPLLVILEGELVKYDPNDPDTYPSVCHTPEEIKRRFGFEGGETLLFSAGGYLGQLVKQLSTED